jgi:hypothetical protein
VHLQKPTTLGWFWKTHLEKGTRDGLTDLEGVDFRWCAMDTRHE